MKRQAKSPPGATSRESSVQRASVKRAQQAGKRQAVAGARRTASSSGRAARVAPVEPDSGDVSVEMPYGIRRAFVLGMIALAGGLIFLVAMRYVPGWQQFQWTLLQATPTTDATATALAADAMRIGLVSGHRGNDSGSVCQDGLTEAQVNFDIAVRVAEQMRAQGYTVDVLDEFDTRLKGYRARALLSIHADSCTYVNDLATGFKVARVLDSKMPEEEDRLVACLKTQYSASTGLRFHANTVTFDMTKYHAFYEIDERTSAAIIEIGFLYLDRQILTRKPELVAQGIVDGILCFVENKDVGTGNEEGR